MTNCFIQLYFSGVFVNNYENFLVWVNTREDQLKIVSAAPGQDLKYILLRLQKAIIKIVKNNFRDGEKATYKRRQLYVIMCEEVMN